MTILRQLTFTLAVTLTFNLNIYFTTGQQELVDDLLEPAEDQPTNVQQFEEDKIPVPLTATGSILDRAVTVTLNGVKYKLDTEVCSGGVMLKRRMVVPEFCGFGVFTARSSGCYSGNETVTGFPNEYTCSSFLDGVQGLLIAEDITTEVSVLSTTEAVATTPFLETESTYPPAEEYAETTEAITPEVISTPDYLKAAEEQLNSTVFEHNSLIEKRGIKKGDLVYDGDDDFPTVTPDDISEEELLVEVETTELVPIRRKKGKRADEVTTTTTTTTVAPDEASTAPSPAPDVASTALSPAPDGASTAPDGASTAPDGASTAPPPVPDEGDKSDEEDTVPLEDDKGVDGAKVLGGRFDLGDGEPKPYDVVPPNFKIVTEATEASVTEAGAAGGEGEGEAGSAEDTVPIKEPVDQLSGRTGGSSFEREELPADFSQVGGDVDAEVEWSSERDDRGGEWDTTEDGELPLKGSLEYDALTGGIEKWVKMPAPSPLFDAHLTLLRKQIDFELINWGSHTDEANGGTGDQKQSASHVSVIGKKDLPYNATWFKILGDIATTASALVPDGLFRDPFSIPGSSEGRVKRDNKDGVSEPLNSLFDDVLRIFGYFTRSYDGSVVGEKVLEGMKRGFVECRVKAKEFRKGCKVGKAVGGGCGDRDELKSLVVLEPVWNEINASFHKVQKVLEFASSTTDLPPLEARINPSKWIFAELMWYAVQITYMFCFESFSDIDPNSFMIVYDAILRLFESDLVTGLWESVGGNLAVFELLLPYVPRSDVGEGRGSDFRNLLVQLDKITGGVIASGIVNPFGRLRRKDKGGRRGRVLNSWDEVKKRRRRRDVGQEENVDLVGDDDEGSKVGSERIVGDDEGRGVGDEEVFGGSEQPKSRDVSSYQEPEPEVNRVFSQSGGWFKNSVTTRRDVFDLEEVTTEDGGIELDSTTVEILEESTVGTTTGLPSSEEGTPEVTSTEENIISSGESITDSTTPITTESITESTTTVEPTTTSTPSTVGTTPTTTPTTSVTTETTENPVEERLKHFEIWDGLAYCLVSDRVGGLKPSLEVLMMGGVCE